MLIDNPATGAMVPFIFRAVQNKYYDQLTNDYGSQWWFNDVDELILKARKEGFTSFWLACFAAIMHLYKEPRRFLEISYKMDATKQHFRRMRSFLLSPIIKDPQLWTDKLIAKVFSVHSEGSEMVMRTNGSSFYAGTATGRTGERGGTVFAALFTEAMHFQDTPVITASEIIEATRQMIPVNTGLKIIESTAKGFNHGRRRWVQAINKEISAKPRFYGWKEMYTVQEFEKIKMGFSDKSLIPQEYPNCLAGDTFVSSSNSNKDGIEQFFSHPEDAKGQNHTWQIETHLGYRVRATANHAFKTHSGWAKLCNLKPAETILLLRPTFSQIYQTVKVNLGLPVLDFELKIDEDFAEFIGLFMGDGSVYKDKRGEYYTLSMALDGKDLECAEKIKNLFFKLFGKCSMRTVGNNGGGLEIRTQSKYFGEFFRSLGMISRRESDGKIKRLVNVPQYILSSPKPVVAAFLRGLFDADGFIGYQYPSVRFFSQYDDFIRQIQILLLGFGITSKLSVADKKAGDGHKYTGRELALRQKETEIFMSEIGFISDRKNNRWRDRKMKHKCYNAIEVKMEDAVKSIEYVGMEEVYDMEITPEHYYSANGLWVHNSPDEAFLVSGRPMFDSKILRQMEALISPIVFEGALTDNKEEISFDYFSPGELKIFKTPKPGRKYLIPADVAGGVTDESGIDPLKSDNRCWSVAPVFDRASWEVVAELRLRCDPGNFGRKLVTLGEYYNWALLAPELNNMGQATLEAMRAEGYPHIFRAEDIWPDGKKQLGFPTDERTKVLALTALRNAIEDMSYKENSITAIYEMFEAVHDEHGKLSSSGWLDCVITRMIGLYLLKFFTLDETYRRKDLQDSPMVVTSLVGRAPGTRERFRSKRASL